MASPIVKRQRKRNRVDTDGDPEFQVAPMIDVLLVLMLFFMAITSTEVLKKNKNLQLADARNAKRDEGNHKHEIIVNVAWDGINSVASFSLNGVNYQTANDLQGALAAQHQQDPASYVVIRADRDTEYSNIADLMTTCANAGISTVSFAVLIGGKNGQAPAADSGGSASQ
ncbi:MAG: biopolymer transporter ExbD [Methylacidiphilales bacterium]|nr:biopolymer transporter ExbD [Candidatus Methylacidiphilales bacterium]